MKKKVLLFIFVLFFIVLGAAISLLNIPLFKLKGNVLGSSGTVTYKSWDEFTTINNNYSYSTLFYNDNTKFYIHIDANDENENEHSNVKVQTTVIEGNVATPMIQLYGLNSKAQIIMENCAINKDGEPISAVLEIENAERWSDDEKFRSEISLDRFMIIAGTQANPNYYNETISEKVKENDILSFWLRVHYGMANAKLTYYKNLSLKNIETGKYNDPYTVDDLSGASLDAAEVDLENSVVDTSITNVNSYYSDIDISYTRELGNQGYMFDAKEGIIPTNGNTTIYYNPNEYSVTLDNEGVPTEYKVKISPYEDNTNNYHGIYCETDYFSYNPDTDVVETNKGLSGAWYGDSSEFLTSGLQGEYDFIYGGRGNGIWFSFFSPQGYTVEPPIKEVDKTTALTTDTFTYKIKQYIPNNYYTNVYNLSTVYPDVFSSDNYFKSFTIEDQIDTDLTIHSDDITVTDINGIDKTSDFTITIQNNKITATPNDNSIYTTLGFYNNVFTLNVPVSKNEVLTTTETYSNQAKVTSEIRTDDPVIINTGTVSTDVSSPKVTYDCQNDETNHHIEYLNPGSPVDVSRTCTKNGEVFVGWINNIGDRNLISSLNIGREDITIYAVYKTDIVIKTTDQTKVYDGTPLVATNDCSVKSGYLFNGDTVTCTNTGSITNPSTGDKIVQTVTITDSENNDVTNLYKISTENASLNVTKRNITVKTSNQEKVYDGVALISTHDCELTDGTTLAVGDNISCTNTGQIINVETKDKTVQSVLIKNSSNIDVTSYYNITKQKGQLKITPKPIEVITNNQEKVYDGTNLVADNNCSSTGIIANQTISCVNSGSRTNVGTSSKVITGVTITDNNNTVITNNYTITTVDGTLTVTPKPITVKADNQEKVYDGDPLNADETCSSTNILGNVSIICTNSGSQTEVGSSIKTLDTVVIKDSNNVDITNNYTITKENGTLTVTPLLNDITLDNDDADTTGTSTITEYCNNAFYLNYENNIIMTPTSEPITLPTKKGYTFQGYYTERDGGLLAIDERGYITNNIVPNVCASRTIYARWVPNKYKLTVIYNNGMDNDEYILDYKEEKTIENPVKENYTFIYWDLTGEGSTMTDTLFVMGYEDAVIEANYEKNPVDCNLIVTSDVYKIDQENRIIYVSEEETVEQIKERITSKGIIVKVDGKEVIVRCEENESTYTISRYWKPKTGQNIIKYGPLISCFITVIILSMLAIKVNKKKEEFK